MRTVFVSVLVALLLVTGLVSTPVRADTTDYVIEISVDGLGSPYLQSLIAGNQLPNIERLQREGVWTNNARNDPNYTVTLPNHVSMVTGRRVQGTTETGHGWTSNSDPNAGQTIHNAKGGGFYAESVFDVAHDNGLRTGMWAGKTKLSLIDTSYDGTNGALDVVTPPDNGRDKIDTYVYDANPTTLVTNFISSMNTNPYHYSLVHLVNPDAAGSWGSTNYNNAVKAVDGYVGQIFNMINNNATLRNKTSIILTADHGGEGNDHSINTAYLNYAIPFYVWSPDVASANRDLYALNSTVRTNPGSSRPAYSSSTSYNADQPIRNSEGANLALDLLDLPAITGSLMNVAQNLDENGTAPVAPEVIAYNAFNETPIGLTAWTPGLSDTELGFSTRIIHGPNSPSPYLGSYDSASSPRRFRMLGYEAETTFSTVDLSVWDSVKASIDILIKDTTYEADDYYRAVLTNGVDSITLADVTGTALNSLAKLTFLHYEVAIPDSWTQATLKISGHTDSTASAEAIDFDHIFFTGVPEPASFGLLALAGLVLARRRRA
jgi:hypothetical protein